jgi:uncharacterized membrane protein YhaH (DUF805 family)
MANALCPAAIEGASMATYSIVHWLIFGIIFIAWIVPAWRITSKAGFPGAWSLIVLVPLVGFVAVWAFAFMKWPIETQAERRGTSE